MGQEQKIIHGLIIEGYLNGSVLLDIQGTQGQLFSVTDNLVGDIFAVSDISGMPIFSINSDGSVTVHDLQVSTSDSVVVETDGVLAKRNLSDMISGDFDSTYLRIDATNGPVTAS